MCSSTVIDPPHDAVTAKIVIGYTGQPSTEKTTDLVAEEDDAEQHRHIARAEYMSNQTAGQWRRIENTE